MSSFITVFTGDTMSMREDLRKHVTGMCSACHSRRITIAAKGRGGERKWLECRECGNTWRVRVPPNGLVIWARP